MRERKKAIDFIHREGVLLVFPIDNRREPRSLWSSFYPRSKMKWEWDSGGDDRVSNLWILREELSRSEDVIYTKWYRGRATFFSRDVFVRMLAVMNGASRSYPMSSTARELLDHFLESSPLSTKTIKSLSDLRGRDNEPTFTRALKELWERLMIVGFGEFDDGAFPSLGMGATSVLFEDLTAEARVIEGSTAEDYLRKALGEESPFYRFISQLKKKWSNLTGEA